MKIKISNITKYRIVDDNLTGKEIYDKYKPDAFINLGLYDTATKANITFMISNGIKSGYYFSQNGIGFTDKPIWTDYNSGVSHFIGGAPVLVQGGQVDIDWGNKYSVYLDGVHERSAIGFNDEYLFLRATTPLSIKHLAELMVKEGCQYAINCDGGGSSHLQDGTRIISYSPRANSSWLLVWYKKKSNLELVAHARRSLIEAWNYVWGTYGQLLTERLLEAKFRQYPKYKQSWGDYIDKNKKKFIGQRSADCVGLIKSFIWWENDNPVYDPKTDLSADGMFNNSPEVGPIGQIPEIPGLGVRFKGHIGIYIGNGEVIEARGTRYGVVLTKLKDRPWTHYLKIPFIEYEGDMIFTDVEDNRWSANDLKEAKELGLAGGYPDGSFKPEEPLTREQGVVLMMRMYRKIKEESQ